MLTLYRRHAPACPHREKGAAHLKCDCPLWAWGSLPNGQWTRKSLGTRSMSQARRVMERWEREECADRAPMIGEAARAFLVSHNEAARATQIKYAKVMRFFLEFCETHRYQELSQLKVEAFDTYRQTRMVAPLTWAKELQVVRSL